MAKKINFHGQRPNPVKARTQAIGQKIDGAANLAQLKAVLKQLFGVSR